MIFMSDHTKKYELVIEKRLCLPHRMCYENMANEREN